MQIPVFAFLVPLLFCTPATPAEPATMRKILASSAAWSAILPETRDESIGAVINDAGELAVSMGLGLDREKEALERAATVMKVKEIDFKKQTLIIVAAGTKPTGGYSVEVKSITLQDGKVKVVWNLVEPAKDAIVTSALTRPGLAVLVEKCAGSFEFDPKLKIGKK